MKPTAASTLKKSSLYPFTTEWTGGTKFKGEIRVPANPFKNAKPREERDG